jgi:hypothetical protein
VASRIFQKLDDLAQQPSYADRIRIDQRERRAG